MRSIAVSLLSLLIVLPPVLSTGELEGAQTKSKKESILVKIPPHDIEVVGDMIIWETEYGHFHVRSIYPSDGSFWAHVNDITFFDTSSGGIQYKCKGKKRPNTFAKSEGKKLRSLFKDPSTVTKVKKK